MFTILNSSDIIEEMNNLILAPSLLSADFSELKNAIKLIEDIYKMNYMLMKMTYYNLLIKILNQKIGIKDLVLDNLLMEKKFLLYNFFI